jgi:phosphoglycolate phosphatase-like HAD superfamily hydrolase
MQMDYQIALRNLIPRHDFFIGIDSDGCIFDTMEVKQKEFFIPNAIKYFDLYEISDELIETWEFVNLYSVFRGGNRFNSIVKVFELLAKREKIRDKNFRLPDLNSLKDWIRRETKLSNFNLRSYFESSNDPDLEKVVNWTEAVNKDITSRMRNIPPFPHARAAVEQLSVIADIVIVSQTPLEALQREWEEHDLKKYVSAIAGQEHGTKTEHLTAAAKGKYSENKILMIGDAKGDLDAANNNSFLFYPVIPGNEDESWKNFLDEGLRKFINGSFSGTYEDDLLRKFGDSLPGHPPWSD